MLIVSSSEQWVERVLRCTDHIQRHLDDDVCPKELAAIAGFSLHHFHRLFRGITGESVMGYVRRLRLENAAQRLRYCQTSVTDVAFSAGYNSHEAFTRAFTANFGKSPSRYRDELLPELRDVPLVVRTEAARRVVALRHQGAYEECFPTWERLMEWSRSRHLAEGSTPDIGLCYDDPDVTEDRRIRYDVCVELGNDAPIDLGPLPSGMSERIIPEGLYAVATHYGNYETINDTYVTLLGKWLPRRGVELHRDPVVENYIKGPDTVPTTELVTEVCVRIKE